MEKQNTQVKVDSDEMRAVVEESANAIFEETMDWLKKRGCSELVGETCIRQYAELVARWQDCEQNISRLGYLAKHPRTGAAILSPFVEASLRYMKLANVVWDEISQSVDKQTGICL